MSSTVTDDDGTYLKQSASRLARADSADLVACIASTYKLAESSCFTVVNFNFYFTATYEVTRKALSCSDPEAVTACE